ncbi:MAG TPA: helix-turn-helix transcriptional regulator [Candidatus Avidesulfovibrio excrementigallinarum]|nr:helix-turn-helix transcriptional regulator [Candidatus Avidesulfovibrio excrementigallinarum]
MVFDKTPEQQPEQRAASSAASPTPKSLRTRARLVEAASRLFGVRGFTGVSTRAIAREAGCNIGLIAFHFGSKQSLYQAARDAVRERLAAIVLPAAAHLRQALERNASPSELLQAVQTEIGGILGSLLMKDYQPERFMLLMRELQETDEQANRLYATVLIPMISALEDVIMVISGNASRRRAHLGAFLLVDAIIGVLRDYPLFHPHMHSDSDAQTDARILAEIIGTGVAAAFGELQRRNSTAENGPPSPELPVEA